MWAVFDYTEMSQVTATVRVTHGKLTSRKEASEAGQILGAGNGAT